MNLLDRYRGGLLGLAAGDALGTTLEFSKPGNFEPIDDFPLQRGETICRPAGRNPPPSANDFGAAGRCTNTSGWTTDRLAAWHGANGSQRGASPCARRLRRQGHPCSSAV